MATALTPLTPRDQDILNALDRCPLTVRQLLKVSETFARSFASERRVRQRLLTLADHEFVRCWQYAVVGKGTLNYYTLAPIGFQLLYGLDEPLPTGNIFRPVGVAHMAHTQALANFIVHTAVVAHRAGVQLGGFYRENALKLTVSTDCLYPDAAFQLVAPDKRPFSFFVEIDNATERLRSEKALDTLERKLRFYEAYQDRTEARFRLLVVTTGTEERLHNILDLARQLARNEKRSLAYGVTLDQYLAHANPVISACTLDHRLRAVPLVPSQSREAPEVVAIPAREAVTLVPCM